MSSDILFGRWNTVKISAIHCTSYRYFEEMSVNDMFENIRLLVNISQEGGQMNI